MLEIIEAPNESKENNKIRLFLAGGITNCENWQKSIIEKIQNEKYEYDKYLLDQVSVFNPRRENFPIDDPNAAEEQITWEYYKLKESNIISFWFANGSINPITLYELGRWGNSQSLPTIIGIDDKYERRSDVEIQTKLSKSYQKIVYNLYDFYNDIVESIHKLINEKV